MNERYDSKDWQFKQELWSKLPNGRTSRPNLPNQAVNSSVVYWCMQCSRPSVGMEQIRL